MAFLRQPWSWSGTPLPSVAAGRESIPGWTRQQRLALLLLLVVGALVGWVGRGAGIGVGPDDSTFLVLSQSLASGHYRSEFLLGAPLHAQYPPGMPLWLLAITTLGGGFGTVQALNLVLLSTTGILIGDALRRLGFAWAGVATAGLVVLNPILSALAGTLYSETLFTTLLVASLWALLRADLVEDAGAGRWVAVAVTFALLAFLVRTIGVAVVAAVLVTLVLRRRWGWAAITAAVSSLVLGGWTAYVVRVARQTERSYVADLSVAPSSTAGSGLLARGVDHLQFYFVEGIPQLFGLPMLPETVIDNLAFVALLLGSGAVGLLWLSRRWPAATLTCLLAGAILLLWPWPITRLVAPLAPLAIGAMMIGASMVVGRAPVAGFQRAAVVTLTTVLSFSALQRHVDRGLSMAACPPEYRSGTYSGCLDVQGRALRQAATVVRDRLPSSAVVAASKEATVFYWGGRRIVSITRLDTDFADIGEAMRRIGATNILLARMYPSEGERLAPRLLAACRQLVEVQAIDAPAAVLALRQPGDGDACEAIERVMAWEIPDR